MHINVKKRLETKLVGEILIANIFAAMKFAKTVWKKPPLLVLSTHLLSTLSKSFGFCRFRPYTAHCKDASAVVNNTNVSQDAHLFNTCAVCVFLFPHSLTDCSMKVPRHCRYCIHLLFFFFFPLDNWCHPWHIYLSGSRLCVQHVHKLLNHVEWIRAALSHTLCVQQEHLSALSEKMLVFLQSLPWVI